MVRPSHAGTVSPAGTVGASGFGAWPHTPLGNAEGSRATSTTGVNSKSWPSTETSVAVSDASSVALYIGPTPSSGAGTDVDFDSPLPANSSCLVGAVDTRVRRNSGA